MSSESRPLALKHFASDYHLFFTAVAEAIQSCGTTYVSRQPKLRLGLRRQDCLKWESRLCFRAEGMWFDELIPLFNVLISRTIIRSK